MTGRVEAFSITHAQVLDGTQSFLQAALATSTPDALDVYGVNEASLSPNKDSYNNEGDDVVKSRWAWLVDADIHVQSGYFSFPLCETLTGRPVETTGPIAAVDEVQTITITATGGTYTLTFKGQTTAPIAYNATTGDIQTALEALNNIDTGDVTVGGGVGARTVTFGGKYAATDVQALVVDDALATGGTVTVAETTKGSPASSATTEIDLWHEDSMNVAPKPGIIKMPSKDEDGVVKTLTIGLYKMQFEPITFEGPRYKDGLKINWDATALYSLKDELGNPFADGRNRVGRILSID